MPGDVVRVRVVVDYDVEVRDEAELVRAALEDFDAHVRDTRRPGRDPDGPEFDAHRRRELADPDRGVESSLAWLLSEGSAWPEVPGAHVISIGAKAEEYDPDYGPLPRDF